MSYADTIKQDIDEPRLVDKWNFDLSKGLWWQMHNTKWTLKDYNQYLAEPNTLVNPWRSVKMFDNWILEVATRSPWYSFPLCIFPITVYYMLQN